MNHVGSQYKFSFQDDIVSLLKRKISAVVKANGPCILILQGFNCSSLPEEYRYFSFQLREIDTLDLDFIWRQVRKEVATQTEFDAGFRWMTVEEYQLFRKYSDFNDLPLVLISNNLYDKQFPYQGSLSDIDNVYQDFYYTDDEVLEPSKETSFKAVTLFYTNIDKSDSGKYYVTFPQFDKAVISVPLFEIQTISMDALSDNTNHDSAEQIELGDDELPFLDLTENLLEDQSCLRKLSFILPYSDKELPFHYNNRISIIKDLCSVQITFTTTSLRRQNISRQADYKKVLHESFGYTDFKEIDFYERIQSKDGQTVRISQAQIIDDIVTQSEAAINKRPFRDIFVTASTGAGKSLIFQIPALYLVQKYPEKHPLTLVVSPLIGLMQDQVESLKGKGIDNSATINGNTLPYEKEQIIDRVSNGKIDVLYLSPETLQARGDIHTLIGERQIGIVIVDEAHIVTTWGRSFRADYWYLGIYLAKLRKKYKFPIVTFTATAIYSGMEDMYFDTCNSLNLINPISYFGKVRRDNILMNVRSSQRELDRQGHDYRQTKNALALHHIQRMLHQGRKSLIYFPTVRLLREFHNYLNTNDKDAYALTGEYYGTLPKEERNETLDEYRDGKIKFVLATKAFGMGIDIPDINSVYHYAPTGTVVDYIQEIGRAARDSKKVPIGLGEIDYLPRDLNEMKQLFGMSAIQKTQIIEVMKKVLHIFKSKGNKRNLTISPEDFRYIFTRTTGASNDDDLNNKVKTVLLMIEKDFASPRKLGYSPFVARPRSVFGREILLATKEQEKKFMKSRLNPYFETVCHITSDRYESILNVNLVGIWEKYYRSKTYPSFKYSIFNNQEREKLQHEALFNEFNFASGIEVDMADGLEIDDVLSQYRQILKVFTEFIDEHRITGEQFTTTDLAESLTRILRIQSGMTARSFAQVLVNAVFEFQKQKNEKLLKERETPSSGSHLYIINQDLNHFSATMYESIKACLKPRSNYCGSLRKVITFLPRSSSDTLSMRLACLGIGESRGLFNYQILGGNDAQIYIRINSVGALEKAINEGNNYQNQILTDVRRRHSLSVAMLQYLFTHPQLHEKNEIRIREYSQWFWDQIENYFMGIIPSEVLEKV